MRLELFRGTRQVAPFAERIVLLLVAVGLYFATPADAPAGTVTLEVKELKGSVVVQPGEFQKTFGSTMRVTLGSEWGELAGTFERKNRERVVWVNTGPAVEIHFANVYPQEIHVPQTPVPVHTAPLDFFSVFVELDSGLDLLKSLPDGMEIDPGPNTSLQGASGTWYEGTVTPIDDLDLLPTSSTNATEIVWDLSDFSETTGNFYLIQYTLPNAFELTIPEPATITLAVCAFLLTAVKRKRRSTTTKKRTRLGFQLRPILISIPSRALLALLIGLLFFGSTPQAQAEKSAKASVNNHIVYQEANIPPGVILRDAGANGVSVAGAKVYHPVKEDFRVSQGDGGDAGKQLANATQAVTIRKLLQTAKKINEQAPKKPNAPTPFEKHEIKFYQETFTALLDFIYLSTDEFPEIAKDADKPLKAITDPLFNPDALEAAKSEATQTLTKTGNTPESPRQLTMVEKPMTEVRKVKNGAKMPMAAAIAVNLDPMGVEWDSPASLGVSLEDVSLDVESSENGSSAVATLHADALFINGTSDIETPPEDAMPLFSLDLLALSYAGTEPFVDLTFDTYGNSVFDSLGNTNVTDVTLALLDALVIDGSTVSFEPGYSFGLELPDDPDESVLFPRTISSATAVTAPEPGALFLSAIALLGAIKLSWHRRGLCVRNCLSS